MTKEELISFGWIADCFQRADGSTEDSQDLFSDKFGCCISIFELEDATILQDFISKEEIRVKNLPIKELIEETFTATADFDRCEDPDKQSLKVEILKEEFFSRSKSVNI